MPAKYPYLKEYCWRNEYEKPIMLVKETKHSLHDSTFEYKDLRDRPVFNYEKLCEMIGTDNADFIFRDYKGELLFEIKEPIEFFGSPRENYQMKTFKTLEQIENYCKLLDEESAKGNGKSFKTHMIQAFINYNFFYDQTSAASQRIKHINKWMKQFSDHLSIAKADYGLDLYDWFSFSSNLFDPVQINRFLGSIVYLSVPERHNLAMVHNKPIILGTIQDPNGWTNLRPVYPEGVLLYHTQEEPVKIITSTNKDEILPHQLVEDNENIVLDSIMRFCDGKNIPFIWHSTFNSNDTNNIRIKTNSILFPHPTEWMLEDVINHHSMVKWFPKAKGDKGKKILRQSKFSSPMLQKQPLQREALANRVNSGELVDSEKMTVLGVPYKLKDPTKSYTYTKRDFNIINDAEAHKLINSNEIILIDAAVDTDPSKHFVFHTSILLKNFLNGDYYKIEISESSEDVVKGIRDKQVFYESQLTWVTDRIIEFINIDVEMQDDKYLFVDDTFRGLRTSMNQNPTILEALENGDIECLSAPKQDGWAKNDFQQKYGYFYASIENRVQFENNPWTIANTYYLENEQNIKLIDEMKNCFSYFDLKNQVWKRIEDNTNVLHRINAKEYANTRIREILPWDKIIIKKRREVTPEGEIKYAATRYIETAKTTNIA